MGTLLLFMLVVALGFAAGFCSGFSELPAPRSWAAPVPGPPVAQGHPRQVESADLLGGLILLAILAAALGGPGRAARGD